jgi:hypothetical protein
MNITHTFGGRAMDRYVYEYEVPDPSGAGDGALLVDEPESGESADAFDFDYAANPDTSAVDVLEAEALLDQYLEEEEARAEPASPAFSREQYDETLTYLDQRIAEVQQELGLVEPVDPVTGRTDSQDTARAMVEYEQWLDQGDLALREHRRLRANEISEDFAQRFGPGREIAFAAMQMADQQVVSTAAAVGEFEGMLEKAAKMRGLDDFDLEKAWGRAYEAHAEISREHPGIGEVAIGLAAIAAIDEQDPSDRERPLADYWGSAASLVRHLTDRPEPETEHDYTKGGTVTSRFFGRNANT